MRATVLLFVFLSGVASAQKPAHEECVANGTQLEVKIAEIETLKSELATTPGKLRNELIQKRLNELEPETANLRLKKAECDRAYRSDKAATVTEPIAPPETRAPQGNYQECTDLANAVEIADANVAAVRGRAAGATNPAEARRYNAELAELQRRLASRRADLAARCPQTAVNVPLPPVGGAPTGQTECQQKAGVLGYLQRELRQARSVGNGARETYLTGQLSLIHESIASLGCVVERDDGEGPQTTRPSSGGKFVAFEGTYEVTRSVVAEGASQTAKEEAWGVLTLRETPADGGVVLAQKKFGEYSLAETHPECGPGNAQARFYVGDIRWEATENPASSPVVACASGTSDRLNGRIEAPPGYAGSFLFRKHGAGGGGTGESQTDGGPDAGHTWQVTYKDQ